MNKEITARLKEIADPALAAFYQKFFKTAKGGYGEGDVFLGIKNPPLRELAKIYSKKLTLENFEILIKSKYHEVRAVALFMLVKRYKSLPEHEKELYFHSYLKHTKYINNWDLVDLSAPHIIGYYLFNKDRSILEKLSVSSVLWEKRISIIATLYFVKRGDFETALKIADILVYDKHDLIHKAVGWVLREIGKVDLTVELLFLNNYFDTMPRTMLRYAIEKFPEELRLSYLKGTIKIED